MGRGAPATGAFTVARRGLQSNCRGDKGPDPGPQRDLWLLFHSVRSNPYLGVGAGSPQANPPCVVEPQGKPSTARNGHNPRPFPFLEILGEVRTENRQKDLSASSLRPIYFHFWVRHI